MLRPSFFIILLLFTLLYSCKNSGKSGGNAMQQGNTAKNVESNLNAEGTGKIMALVNDYYLLKDALVAANAPKADAAAQKLNASTQKLEDFLLQDSANTLSLHPETDSLLAGTAKILSVKDETTEYKRIWFDKVSDAVYKIIKKTGLKNAGIYRQYCPMALNDKGAYWLSKDVAIKNPYFGTKMLECGETTDTL